jgi:transcription antitermination factor NusG
MTTTTGFAVGDKVKITSSPDDETFVGKTGTINNIDPHTSYTPFQVTLDEPHRYTSRYWVQSVEKIEEFAVGDKVTIEECSDVRSVVGSHGHITSIESTSMPQRFGVRPEVTIPGWGTSVVYVEKVKKFVETTTEHVWAVGDKVTITLSPDNRSYEGETATIAQYDEHRYLPFQIRFDTTPPSAYGDTYWVKEVKLTDPPEKALAEFKAKLWKLGQRMKEERGYGSEIDAVFAELGVTAPADEISTEPLDPGTVVGQGAVRGYNVWRRRDVRLGAGEPVWEMTGSAEVMTWAAIVAFVGSADLQILWKPGMTYTTIER